MSAYCKSHKQCASLLQITVAQKVNSDSEDTANVGQAPSEGFVCLIVDAQYSIKDHPESTDLQCEN